MQAIRRIDSDDQIGADVIRDLLRAVQEEGEDG